MAAESAETRADSGPRRPWSHDDPHLPDSGKLIHRLGPDGRGRTGRGHRKVDDSQ